MSKVKCKHCGFQWVKGEDSGHSKDECIERLKAKVEKIKNLVFEVWASTEKLNKNLLPEWIFQNSGMYLMLKRN